MATAAVLRGQTRGRYRLAQSGERWCYVSAEGRPFFPLFGANASLDQLALLDARAWPREIPKLPVVMPALGVAVRLPDRTAAMAALRALPADHEWKSRWVDFLKERYEYTIARVNEAYGLESTSFSDLLVETYRSLDGRRTAVARDDADFFSAALDQWGTAVCLPDPRPGRPSIWLDRFDPDPPAEVVAMRAPDSPKEGAAWLLSREKAMADWTPAPRAR